MKQTISKVKTAKYMMKPPKDLTIVTCYKVVRKHQRVVLRPFQKACQRTQVGRVYSPILIVCRIKLRMTINVDGAQLTAKSNLSTLRIN